MIGRKQDWQRKAKEKEEEGKRMREK